MKFEDFEPMLANPVDIDKVGKYSNYWMEVKLDGVRCIAIKKGDNVQLFTRSGKSMTEKLTHLVEQLKRLRHDFVLDGEIGYLQWMDKERKFPFAIDFNATMRVLGSGPEEAVRKQERNLDRQPIKFVVFDLLYWYPDAAIGSTRQLERRMALAELYHLSMSTEGQPDILLSEKFDKWDNSIYTDIVSLGGEGVMLKNPDGYYHVGKRRANTWYKVKAFDTVDCRIVGFEPGKGKYEGAIGALVLQDPTGRELRISGMTDSQRNDMTVYFRERYAGKVCEVRFFGKVGSAKDGYRHPQFVRMRPDLDKDFS